MRAKTFLEIHHALLNWEPLSQWTSNEFGFEPIVGLNYGLCLIEFNGRQLWHNEIFRLFLPNGVVECGLWAGESEDDLSYNDIRQNIILLCAAIN